MVNYTEVVVSDFEQGGFYVGNYYDYDSSTEIRSPVITPFEETGIIRELTVNCAPYQWSFVCFNDGGTFVQISESLGYKDSGTIIDVSSYNVSKVRIELHDANRITPEPPKSATLCVEYTYGTSWHMEGTNPVPDNCPHFVQHGLRNPTGKTWFKVENNELKLGSISGRELGKNFYKPFARGMWQMNGLEPNTPYEPMMPGIMRHVPDPPPPEPDNPERANWLSHWFIRLGDIDAYRESVMGYISQKADRTFQPGNFKSSPHWNNSVQELNDIYYKMLGIDSVGGLIEWNYIEGGET